MQGLASMPYVVNFAISPRIVTALKADQGDNWRWGVSVLAEMAKQKKPQQHANKLGSIVRDVRYHHPCLRCPHSLCSLLGRPQGVQGW